MKTKGAAVKGQGEHDSRRNEKTAFFVALNPNKISFALAPERDETGDGEKGG